MGRNLKNAVIAFLTPLPSLLFYHYFLGYCSEHECDVSSPSNGSSHFPSLVWNWCYQHPILLANLLFFLNVDLLFWIIGLLQSCHWLIDLYWTVIPVLLMHYYATHPLAKCNPWRSKAVVLITWVWSMRLTHNYFRREKWQWGAREDWRFNDMRQQYGKSWWWVCFFPIYVAQQVFLIGICMPFYVIHSVDEPWNIWDFIAVVVCVTGIIIAYYADTQLHNFVTRNEKLKQLGEPVVPNLDKGIWHYSRHPNYFGEQLWWWGLAIFGWNLECGWTAVGALINSMCLAYVTLLVERRMLEKDYRAEAYRVYQETTSVWVPWFKSSPQEGKEKDN